MRVYEIYKFLYKGGMKKKRIARFFNVTHQSICQGILYKFRPRTYKYGKKLTNKEYTKIISPIRKEYFEKYYIKNREYKRDYFREQHKKRMAEKVKVF